MRSMDPPEASRTGEPLPALDPGPELGARDRQLAGLYSTARSLAALDDVDAVLSKIVQQTRELTGADLTYLSVLEGSVLKVRATSGVVSSRFSNAEIPSDSGIGGRVVETRSPFWVSNYLLDETTRHSDAFDEVVSSEGLVTLLGVPMLTPSGVLGVLYVADRVERSHDPDDVAVVSALADHAAIALQNARLYEDSRSALAELRLAYENIARSAQVHEALSRVVLTGGGQQEIATLLHDSLGGEVLMVDRYDSVAVAQAGSEGDPLLSHTSIRAGISESWHAGKSVVAEDSDGWRTTTGINTGAAYLGAIIWRSAHRPEPIEVRTIERASYIAGLLTLKEEALVLAEERLAGELLTETIRATPPFDGGLVGRARAARIDIASFNAVAVVVTEGREPTQTQRLLLKTVHGWGALAGVHDGHLVVALHSENVRETALDLHRRLRSQVGLPVLVCIAGTDAPATGLARPFMLAARCSGVLKAAGVTDVGTTTVENGMFAAVFDPDRAEELTLFIQTNLGSLNEYDQRHQSSLTQTLTRLFENGGNVAKTARDLHVHINTITKRLDRVGVLIGEDWAEPDRSLSLQLALRLQRLRDASRDGD